MGTDEERPWMSGEQLDGDCQCCSLTCALCPAVMLSN